MARHRVIIMAAVALCMALLTGASGAAAVTGAAPRAAASGDGWGEAEEVPGTAALNTGGSAVTESVSCGAAGNCSAGGYYQQASGSRQAFAAVNTNGTWGAAQKVAAALNKGGQARISSVSCAAAGNCSAGGYYTDGSGHLQAFVVGESGGAWGAAREVAAALNSGGNAVVNSVSCASAGNCTAGGEYVSRSSGEQAFVVSEKDGAWGTPKTIAAALNKGRGAQISSVSCALAGSCSAAGSYTDRSGFLQAFVVGKTRGAWGAAREVAAALNSGGSAAVNSVSCASAGNCSAGGEYVGRSSGRQAFVVGETDGTWDAAERVPGIAALNKGGSAQISSVSCAVAGSCSAAGYFTGRSGRSQAFVAGEKNGAWGIARAVAAALGKGLFASASSVSCASAGNCSAGGYYTDGSRRLQAFVVGETDGTWGTAQEVPGSAALNQGGLAEVLSVSCAAAGYCGAGGYYHDIHVRQQAFVASEPGRPRGHLRAWRVVH